MEGGGALSLSWDTTLFTAEGPFQGGVCPQLPGALQLSSHLRLEMKSLPGWEASSCGTPDYPPLCNGCRQSMQWVGGRRHWQFPGLTRCDYRSLEWLWTGVCMDSGNREGTKRRKLSDLLSFFWDLIIAISFPLAMLSWAQIFPQTCSNPGPRVAAPGRGLAPPWVWAHFGRVLAPDSGSSLSPIYPGPLCLYKELLWLCHLICVFVSEVELLLI